MASTSSSSSSAAADTTPTSSRSLRSKLTCLCSPTNHPGSFRCSRHRNNPKSGEAGGQQHRGGRASGKGRSVRALLLQKIGSPSDRDRQRRHRGDFEPRPSRLRLMNK